MKCKILLDTIFANKEYREKISDFNHNVVVVREHEKYCAMIGNYVNIE